MTVQAELGSSIGKHPAASPHGDPEEVFEGVWVVSGGVKMPMLVPMKLSRAMTVVRDDTGDLTVFNSMRLSDAGLEKLAALGRIKHVVRLAGFHGRDDAFYRERFGASVYAIKGQRYTRGMAKDPSSTPEFMQPDVWLTEESALPIADASLKIFHTSTPIEAVCLLKRHGGVLITGDSLQNTPVANEFVNLPAKLMMKKMGFFKPCGVGPGWLQFASPDKQDVRSILELEFEHVLPGHGSPVMGGAREKYRPALEGELKGCH